MTGKICKALSRLKWMGALGLIGCLLAFVPKQIEGNYAGVPMQLSAYGLFAGDMADQIPAEGVIPYKLNTPLFSDYAEKLRFVKLPEGTSVAYNAERVLDFPIGTTIIKTFYYPHDARDPSKGRRLMETRLLIHEEKGWKALPYHWDEEQQDAYLEVAGDTKTVQWRDENGKKQKVDYVMPNVNQCKSCHSWDGAMTPIGPSARQLNGDLAYASGSQNQLQFWEEYGVIEELPEDLMEVPHLPDWEDPSDGTTAARARAWLDINCAHCHNPHGPASTSGFFLDIHQDDPTVLGVYKTPVAAGRGSGGLKYDIHPGRPGASILVYRIESTDPGVRMPEVGRSLVHKEGLATIKQWIAEMKDE